MIWLFEIKERKKMKGGIGGKKRKTMTFFQFCAQILFLQCHENSKQNLNEKIVKFHFYFNISTYNKYFAL